MERRNGFRFGGRGPGSTRASRYRPGGGMAPVPSPRDGAPVWLTEERVFVERVIRYARLATWLMAASIVALFFSVAVSVASHEFGIVPPGGTAGGDEYFGRPAGPDAPTLEARP